MASRRITPLSAAGVSSLLGGLAAALIGTSAGAAVIVEIEVKADSQSRLSRPAYDKTFRVVASAGFLNHDLGIGIIANPTVVNANDDRDFALHQDREPNSTLYSNHVPDPASSTVYFRFDVPTVVD